MGEVVDIDRDTGEPPADLGVDVRGLPAARARLACYGAWRARSANELVQLEVGRSKLAERIAKAEQASKRQAAEVDADATSVVEQIKRGIVDWTFGQGRKMPEAGPNLAVEHQALSKLDSEIAAKRETIAAIDARLPGLAHAALVEHAVKIGGEYQAALDAARDAMTALEGLNVVLGRGGKAGRSARCRATPSPDIFLNSHRSPHRCPKSPPLRTSGARWHGHGRLTRAPTHRRFLQFAPHNPSSLEGVVYHELTAVERRLVDVRAASSHH